jgi:hypothetical protein
MRFESLTSHETPALHGWGFAFYFGQLTLACAVCGANAVLTSMFLGMRSPLVSMFLTLRGMAT